MAAPVYFKDHAQSASFQKIVLCLFHPQEKPRKVCNPGHVSVGKFHPAL
jgi:hypothetical protein